jgi:flagellar hook-associated protein 3
MRVPNISIYANATYNLGGLTSDLQNANEVMATQKRINSISDDPIGLSQVLDLKVSIGNLDQIEKNVNMGISWLKGTENALGSANDLILDAKTQVSRLINASMSASEREDAIGGINSIIEQIVTLGNTQINGSYIFGGTDTDTLPLTYNKNENPPEIVYNGNNTAFEIKTDKQVTVPVGGDGKAVFWTDAVEINLTNNTIMFKEDNGHGSASEKIMKATIADGTYTKDQLEVAVKNALNDLSSTQGYGMTYEVSYDGDSKQFSIGEDGTYDGFLRTEFMWETGEDAYLAQISASPSINPDDIDVKINRPDALTIDTPQPQGSEPFRLIWQGDDTWAIANNPGYTIIPSTISGSDTSIGIDLNESGTPDITITLDKPVSTKGEYIEFEIVSAQGDHSLGHEIGFNQDNSIYAPPTSDSNAVFVTDLDITLANRTIAFSEDGGVTTLYAIIPVLNYTDMDTLSTAIKDAMELAGSVNYAVSYDPKESRFNIREDGTSLDELILVWSDPLASATAKTLGYYPQDDTISYPSSDSMTQLHITLDSTNNKIAFQETDIATGTPSGTLWATVPEGTYKDMAAFTVAVETAMEDASLWGYSVDYDVAYDDATNLFSIGHSGGGLSDLDLLWGTASGNNSIGNILGFDAVNDTGGGLGPAYSGDNEMVLMSFDNTNNAIDFEEVSIDGTISEEISVRIPEGEYTDLDDVATEMQKALREDSPNGIKYEVSYDYAAGEFMIKGSDANLKEFSLLWQTGENRDQSADELLGFYGDDRVSFSESDEPVVNITITAANNKIDFKEVLKGNEGKDVDTLTAFIKIDPPATSKTYTSHSQLALDVEKALEEESYKNGNKIDYSVSWDVHTKDFTIKENGTQLAQFDLAWQTGENAPLASGGTGQSIGGILGFDAEDDLAAPVESEREVEWGIFNTLIDLNQYLKDNDTDGIERTLGRIDAHFNSMISKIVEIGNNYSRLEIRDKITTENSLSLTERRSTIEDADIIEALMNLQAIDTAYQASLSSSAKIMKLSLVDYL